jgi:hypothetical protein
VKKTAPYIKLLGKILFPGKAPWQQHANVLIVFWAVCRRHSHGLRRRCLYAPAQLAVIFNGLRLDNHREIYQAIATGKLL